MTVRVGKRSLYVPVLLCLCYLLVPLVHAADIRMDPGSTVGMLQAGADGFIDDSLNDKSRLNSHYTDFMSRGDKYAREGEYDKAFNEYNGALRYLDDHAENMGETIKNQRTAIVYNHAAEVYNNRRNPGDDVKRRNALQTAESYQSQSSSSSGSLCLMTTVFNRTAMANGLQLVRDFREGSIMKSYAGSRFMQGFNAWYYSFSPAASVSVDERPRIKSALEIGLAPTIGIVLVSQYLYSLFLFNPEIAAIGTFIAGGALYGLIYFFPAALLILMLAARTGLKIPAVSAMRKIFVVWALVLGTLIFAVLGSVDTLTVVSSGLLVICSIIVSSGTASLSLAGYILQKRDEDTRLLFVSRRRKNSISGDNPIQY